MADLQKRIVEECSGHDKPKKEIPELILDNCKIDSLSGVLDEFENLEFLSMNNCNLKTLKSFPALKNLKRLELMDNQIAEGLDTLSGCTGITHLNLSGNKLKELAALEPLKKITALRCLETVNCDVGSQKDFRTKVFEMLPELVFLDGIDKEGNQMEDSDLDDEEDEMNGDAEDEESEESGEDDEVGLSYLNSSRVEDEDETEDFAPGADDDDDEDDEGDEEDAENDTSAKADATAAKADATAEQDGAPPAKRQKSEKDDK